MCTLDPAGHGALQVQASHTHEGAVTRGLRVCDLHTTVTPGLRVCHTTVTPGLRKSG